MSNFIISDAQKNYSVFTSLKEMRQCLSEAMSELHATGKTSSEGEEIRTLFRTKILQYDKITKEAVNIISENHLKKARSRIFACKMEIKKSINLFYDASDHPKYDVDFSELIKEYRKPKDLEDAKFLFELELNKCTYYHDFDRVFDAFKVLMIEYYRTDGGSEKRYEEINVYYDRFMRVVESAVENSFFFQIKELKGDYFDHTLRINKLWREIQIHTKAEVKDLESVELIKEGVVPQAVLIKKIVVSFDG